MTCEERKDLLGLYAMDALDPVAQAEMRAHLQSECPTCAGYLAEVEAIAALLPLGLTPTPPDPRLKSRLLARIASAAPTARTIHSGRPPGAHWPWMDALLGGAIAAAIGIVVVSIFVSRQMAALDGLRARVAQNEARIGVFQSSVDSANQTMQMLQSPAVQVVSAEGTPLQPKAAARVYLDRAHHTLYLHAAGLHPPGKNKTYELWLINDKQRPQPMGTFDVNSHGEASLQRQIPGDVGRLALVAVTDEPAGGMPQPTGQIQLKGAIQ